MERVRAEISGANNMEVVYRAGAFLGGTFIAVLATEPLLRLLGVLITCVRIRFRAQSDHEVHSVEK